MNKKLLVIVPFHNVEQYLDKCIKSILHQTYKNIELVLVDDYSIDNSYQIAKSYEHLNNVTVLQNKENKGCYYSVNKALNYSKTKTWDYWHFHGADDTSDPSRFKKVLSLFIEYPEIKAIPTTYKRTNHHTGVWNIRNSEGIAFYRREVFENMGYYDNTRFAGDTEYMHRTQRFYSKYKNIKCVKPHTEVLYFAEIQTSKNNLTQIYTKSVRAEYCDRIEKTVNNFSTPEDFYKEFFE
jgi:glycosyltransferase involved in cell wall biosynthesis